MLKCLHIWSLLFLHVGLWSHIAVLHLLLCFFFTGTTCVAHRSEVHQSGEVAHVSSNSTSFHFGIISMTLLSDEGIGVSGPEITSIHCRGMIHVSTHTKLKPAIFFRLVVLKAKFDRSVTIWNWGCFHWSVLVDRHEIVRKELKYATESVYDPSTCHESWQ